MMSQNAEAVRNDDDQIQARSGGDVGAFGGSPTVPGHIELDPGATHWRGSKD